MVELLSGNARIKAIEKPDFMWPHYYKEKLFFKEAWVIEHKYWTEGMQDCVYRVNEREFKDLSCLAGETCESFPKDCEIRKHADGTKFLFSYEDVPTFDSEDRVWDSMLHMALYEDAEGINLIHCRHGYQIPRINIYCGLVGSIPPVDEWLEKLGIQLAGA